MDKESVTVNNEDMKDIENILEPEREDTKKNKEGTGIIVLLLLVVVINVIVTSGILFLYDRYMVPRITGIDIKGFIEEQRDLYAARKINDEQLRANYDAMEKKIKSMPSNRIMISADVLIGENIEVVRP